MSCSYFGTLCCSCCVCFGAAHVGQMLRGNLRAELKCNTSAGVSGALSVPLCGCCFDGGRGGSGGRGGGLQFCSDEQQARKCLFILLIALNVTSMTFLCEVPLITSFHDVWDCEMKQILLLHKVKMWHEPQVESKKSSTTTCGSNDWSHMTPEQEIDTF